MSCHLDGEFELIGSFLVLRPHQSPKPLNVLGIVQINGIKVYSEARGDLRKTVWNWRTFFTTQQTFDLYRRVRVAALQAFVVLIVVSVPDQC